MLRTLCATLSVTKASETEAEESGAAVEADACAPSAMANAIAPEVCATLAVVQASGTMTEEIEAAEESDICASPPRAPQEQPRELQLGLLPPAPKSPNWPKFPGYELEQ